MTSKRTLAAQTVDLIDQTVTLQGWVATKRDHGQITFIDLRDRSGLVQCVAQNQLGELTTESVVQITGQVTARPQKLVNPDLPTGTVEIQVESYQILNMAQDLPIQVRDNTLEEDEQIRLRYRYLDLRRQRLQRNLRLRSELFAAFRKYLLAEDFVEIETPLLTKSTKEGARDFIVPSRFQPGKFYALPQSPQQYKQLLMTAGFERYFQFARCIRDEDLRADRGFEFTQLDLEMSFVNQQQAMQIIEDLTKKAVQAVGGELKDQQFPVINYQEALDKYGEDKFDLRTPEEKERGVLAFAWVINFPFFKEVDQTDQAEVRDGKSGWTFTHNPFSQPQPEFVNQHLNQENIGQILTTQYDLVCNGYEVGGGSIRAHDPRILRTTFEIMGYSEEEIENSVGHMLKAFSFGTPPHGGIAFGIDRLVMLLSGEKSIKETIAFPMTSTGRTAVMDAPSPVDQAQLTELSLEVAPLPAFGEQVYPAILRQFRDHDLDFEHLTHEPVITSAQAQEIRQTQEYTGAKALVCQADDELILLVVPGTERADFESVAKQLGKKKVRLADAKLLEQRTGLPVGAVPPMGSVLGLPTYLDARFGNSKDSKIVFNIGQRDHSAVIKLKDYLRLEKPTRLK